MRMLAQLVDDDGAVSPVIGVILMVAITVILAAVIGTFVLGLGGQVSQSAPQASFEIQEAGGGTTVTEDGSAVDLFTLEHRGSDTIQADELQIQLSKAGGSTVTIWDGGAPGSTPSIQSPDPDGTDGPNDLLVSTTTVPPQFEVTDTLTISAELADDGNVQPETFDAADSYTATLIDNPSGQIIAEKEITL